jgi:hypothetical protein
MITSTLLTLLVVPTAYSILEGIVDTVKRILRWRPFRRKPAEPAPHAPAPATPEPRSQRTAAAKGERERSGEGATVAYATTDES